MSIRLVARAEQWDNTAVQQPPITDEEISEAKSMFGFAFWAPLIVTVLFLLVVGIVIGLNAIGMAIIGCLVVPEVVFLILRWREYQSLQSDLQVGMLQVIEGAPEKVWMGRSGFCFLRLHGKKIRVPNDRYSELKEATMARVAVLPNSLIAVRVDL